MRTMYLLILPVLESVDEWVDGGGHPGENTGYDVDGREGHVVVDHVDQHEGEEADQEGDEDGQHHLCQSKVLDGMRMKN